jgi:hypothetical protein
MMYVNNGTTMNVVVNPDGIVGWPLLPAPAELEKKGNAQKACRSGLS